MSREREEGIAKALVEAFPFLEGHVAVQRERRIWVEVELPRFREVFDRAAGNLGFCIFCLITGLDEGERLGFIYHLADESGAMLNIHTWAPKADPRIATVTGRFPSAHISERELVDLFGAIVEGLPPGKRYPLPDGWPEGQYPLRKDWKPAGGAAKTLGGRPNATLDFVSETINVAEGAAGGAAPAGEAN
jgi:membrane-bound hydrogenase subunit beta